MDDAAFPCSPDGRISSVDGAPALHFQRLLRHPPEAVWRALTDPAALARWMQAEAVVDPRLGGRFEMIFQGGPHRMAGEITRWEPPSVLEYTWPEKSAGGDSLVRFTLRPTEGGCVLTLRHVLRGGGDVADFASGWHWHLDCLDAALVGEARAFDEPRWAGVARGLCGGVVAKSLLFLKKKKQKDFCMLVAL